MSHSQCIRAMTELHALPAVWATVRKPYQVCLVIAVSLALAACSQISGLLHSDIAPAPVEVQTVPSQSNNAVNCTQCADKAPVSATATATPVTLANSSAVHSATPASTSASTTAVAATTSTAATDSAKPYFVHVGAFAVPSNANSAYQKVLATGILVSTQEVDTPKGRLTRVRAGPFLTRADADTAAKRIHELELDAVVLRDAPAH